MRHPTIPAVIFKMLGVLLFCNNICLAVNVDENTNLLQNAEFESSRTCAASNGWQLMKVEGYDAEYNPNDSGGRTGASCLRVTGKSVKGYGSVYQLATLEPNTTYKFTCWLKNKGLKLDCPYVCFWDKNSGEQLKSYSGGQIPAVLDEWWYYEKTFTTPDADGIRTTLHLFLFKGEGEAWIDDASLKKVGRPPQLLPLRVLECPAVETAPIVDGCLDDAAWQNAACATNFSTLAGNIAREQTQVLCVHDGKFLYLGFKCFQPTAPQTKKRKPYDDPYTWQDDSLEIFLNEIGDYHSYTHLMINAMGARTDEKALWRDGKIECDLNWNAQWEARTQTNGTGWQAEVAIPFSTFSNDLRQINRLRINFCRTYLVGNEQSTWSPLVGSFHQPRYFGNLLLSDKNALKIKAESFSIGAGGYVSKGENRVKASLHNTGRTQTTVKAVFTVIPERGDISVVTLPLKLNPGASEKITIPYKIKENCNLNFAVVHENATNYVSVLREYAFNLQSSEILGHVVFSNYSCVGWYADATSKIMRDQEPPGKTDGIISLSLAANEHESFQMVLTPKNDINKVELALSPLTGPGGAVINDARLYVVDYIPVVQPSDSLGYVDDWPDPLYPYTEPFAAKAGQNQPVWVTIYAAPDQVPGLYKGSMSVKINDAAAMETPLEVTVRGFRLPKEPFLRTAFGRVPAHEIHWAGIEGNIESYRKYNEVINENFRQHRVSPYFPMVWSFIKYEVLHPESDEPQVTVNFTDFDKAAERYLDEFGFNSFGLLETWAIYYGNGTSIYGKPCYDAIGGIPDVLYGYKKFSPQYNLIYTAIGNAVTRHIKEKGWLDKAYLYVLDEPAKDKFPYVRQGMDLMRQAYPGVKRLLTLSDQPIQPDLYGSVDIWVPLVTAFDPALAREREKAGEECWFYTASVPHTPYPEYFIDHPGIEHRLVFWIAWKYQAKGVLYYSVDYWNRGEGPAWKAYMDAANGSACLIYPPSRDKIPSKTPVLTEPVNSIRWELIREGIEDYDYFSILREKTLALQKLNKRKYRKILRDSEVLLNIPETILETAALLL